MKDLGVMIDNRIILKFDVHINHIVKHAHRIANSIHKCFVSKHPPTLTFAFTTYVRLLLEYATCVWSPHYVAYDERLLESSYSSLALYLRVSAGANRDCGIALLPALFATSLKSFT